MAEMAAMAGGVLPFRARDRHSPHCRLYEQRSSFSWQRYSDNPAQQARQSPPGRKEYPPSCCMATTSCHQRKAEQGKEETCELLQIYFQDAESSDDTGKYFNCKAAGRPSIMWPGTMSSTAIRSCHIPECDTLAYPKWCRN